MRNDSKTWIFTWGLIKTASLSILISSMTLTENPRISSYFDVEMILSKRNVDTWRTVSDFPADYVEVLQFGMHIQYVSAW